MKKYVSILLLITVSSMAVLIAGCNGSKPTPTSIPTEQVQPTGPLPTYNGYGPSSTYDHPKIAMTIEGDKWTALALDSGIVKGTSYGFGFNIFTLPYQDKKICGQEVNFYLDDKPAPGKWNIDPNPECWVSAQLLLSADDIAPLSLGAHTLKVDYLGDTTHAPSHWEGTFNVKVTASG